MVGEGVQALSSQGLQWATWPEDRLATTHQGQPPSRTLSWGPELTDRAQSRGVGGWGQ